MWKYIDLKSCNLKERPVVLGWVIHVIKSAAERAAVN